MFYKNYLDDYYYNALFENYSTGYLESIDEENFKKVYEIFQKYKFYFIEDIIEGYLEIFELDSNKVEEKIISLKEELGEEYLYIIGEDLSLLEKIID